MNKLIPFLILIGVVLSCSKQEVRLGRSICLTEAPNIKHQDVEQAHLTFFAENMQLTERGHFLSGVYQVDSDLVYTSIYEGPQLDSLVQQLTLPNTTKNPLGNNHYSWSKPLDEHNGVLYIYSTNGLIQIIYPQSIADQIIPNNGSSLFFSVCD